MTRVKANQKKVIFMSHVHDDSAQAKALKLWLEDNLLGACEIYVSSVPESMPLGSDWPRKIREKLRQSDMALCLVTPNSIEGRWLYFESGATYAHDLPVVPICFGGVKKGDLKPPLQFLVALEIPNPEAEKQLLEVVAKQVGLNTPKRPDELTLPEFRLSRRVNPYSDWLYSEIDLIEHERTFAGREIWVASANLDHDVIGPGPLADVVSDNLERAISYVYVVPKRPEIYVIVEAIKNIYSAKRFRPAFKEIESAEFDNITETNITVYNPIPSPDRKGDAEVFVELPIALEVSERCWAKVHKHF